MEDMGMEDMEDLVSRRFPSTTDKADLSIKGIARAVLAVLVGVIFHLYG
jgi:hypothetical protein